VFEHCHVYGGHAPGDFLSTVDAACSVSTAATHHAKLTAFGPSMCAIYTPGETHCTQKRCKILGFDVCERVVAFFPFAATKQKVSQLHHARVVDV
jgi:hypothetical protein